MRWFYQQGYALRLMLEKFSLRERYLLLITVFALILMSFQGGLMLLGLDNNEEVLNRIETQMKKSEEVQQELVDYQKASQNPQILALRNSNDDLADRLVRLKSNISDINERLMSPERMLELLRGLLENQSNLTIIEFEVLPVVDIESKVDDSSLFFQHGIRMSLEGNFEALTTYLEAIESSSDYNLFWDGLTIETEDFPRLQIEINVHTLSQNEEWLNV